MSLPEHLLLQHFYAGLDKESAHHLGLTSRGSFAHLSPSEGKEVLNKILNRTSFVCIHEPVQTEPMMCHEEPSEIELEPLESQSVDSTPETSPELKPETPEEEDLKRQIDSSRDLQVLLQAATGYSQTCHFSTMMLWFD